jgi:hypothetical protein
MNKLPSTDRTRLLRSECDLPHYTDRPHRIFPFRHVELWADTEPDALRTYVREFGEIVSQISRTNLAAIRNGLDHKRGELEFPSRDEMVKFVDHFRRGFLLADAARYIPKWWWLQARRTDQYGLTEYDAYDYNRRELRLQVPSPVLGLPTLNFRQPAIVAPGNLTGQPNAEIIFRPVERSEFASYWQGFPRRRRIPGSSSHPLPNTIQVASTEDLGTEPTPQE